MTSEAIEVYCIYSESIEALPESYSVVIHTLSSMSFMNELLACLYKIYFSYVLP